LQVIWVFDNNNDVATLFPLPFRDPTSSCARSTARLSRLLLQVWPHSAGIRWLTPLISPT